MIGRTSLAVVAAALALAPAAARATNKAPLKSHEHEVERAGMKLALYEKWAPGEEGRWRQNDKIVILVHGATWSSKCTFDPVEGYSLMDALADAGWDVFALDLHGYGKSGHNERDITESPSAADDIDAAADYIRALRWVEKVHVLGYQWGAQPAGIFAMKHPNKVAKLVLFGMRYQASDKIADPTTSFRQNSMANAMLKPEDGDLEPDFVRRRAQVCVKTDPRSPNGALRDLARPSFVDPAKVKAPTLMLMGDHDAEPEVLQDRLDFFQKLAAKTREFLVLAGLGKYATFERGRARLEQAVISFLEQP
jgi:pimeloyl-ACP methyl ester carboxylesterase